MENDSKLPEILKIILKNFKFKISEALNSKNWRESYLFLYTLQPYILARREISLLRAIESPTKLSKTSPRCQLSAGATGAVV